MFTGFRFTCLFLKKFHTFSLSFSHIQKHVLRFSANNFFSSDFTQLIIMTLRHTNIKTLVHRFLLYRLTQFDKQNALVNIIGLLMLYYNKHKTVAQ